MRCKLCGGYRRALDQLRLKGRERRPRARMRKRKLVIHSLSSIIRMEDRTKYFYPADSALLSPLSVQGTVYAVCSVHCTLYFASLSLTLCLMLEGEVRISRDGQETMLTTFDAALSYRAPRTRSSLAASSAAVIETKSLAHVPLCLSNQRIPRRRESEREKEGE